MRDVGRWRPDGAVKADPTPAETRGRAPHSGRAGPGKRFARPDRPANPDRVPPPRPAREPAPTDDIWLLGRHEVMAALTAGTPLQQIVLQDGGGDSLRPLVAQARERGIKFSWVPAAAFRQRFGDAAQGAAAQRSAFTYATLDDLLARAAGNTEAILVLLNQVQDPRNLGAIVRTCEVAGVAGMVIPRHRAAAMTAAALATAQGAAEYLPVAQVVNLGEAVRTLKRDGWWVIGADAAGTTRYDRARYTGRLALLMGGEDAGLGPMLTGLCDEVVSIPVLGRTPSLNVGVSTSVLVFEMQRQKGFARK